MMIRLAFLFFTTLLSGLSMSANAQNSFAIKPDDGTYKTLIITDPEDCTVACKSDSTCRGSVIYQADISIPQMECRLNNGFGENTPFPILPPEPLDTTLAVAELNAYRARHGRGAVRLNEALIKASAIHAKDLSVHGIASHTGSDGSSHSDRIQRQGYYFSIAGENVATGQKSWDKVFKAWQDSPGHNENLLQPDVTEFGIALVFEPTTTYTTYWAMVVAAPLPDYPQLSSEKRG